MLPGRVARQRTVRDRLKLVGLAIAAGLFIFALGVFLPRFVIADYAGTWDEPQAEAAKRARFDIIHNRGPMQRLMTTQVSVIDVKPDPSDCHWGYPTPANGIVTVQTYTFFGLPDERWTVTCRSSSRIARPWWSP